MTSPAPSPLNVSLLVRENIPSRIRTVQGELRAIEAKKVELLTELRTLVDTAVLHGVELFPQGAGSAARASGPGGTDTPPSLAGIDGVSPAPRAA